MGSSSTLVRHPVLAGVDAAGEALAGLAEANAWPLSSADLIEVLERVDALEARLAAVKLSLVADADSRHLGAAAATSTAGWLRGRLHYSPGEACRTVTLALALRDDCPDTAAALAAGACTVEQARTLTTVLAGLPPVDSDLRRTAEQFLVGQTAVQDPSLLRRTGRALTERLTTTPDTDGRLRDDLARRTLSAVTAADGMVRLSGWLDSEGWAQLSAVLDPLAAPRPAGPDGHCDPRSAGRRRADALIDVAHLAATATNPTGGGLAPTLNVTIDYGALTGQLRATGRLNTDEPISPAAARRLACDANIIPAILDTAGQPLDIGRASRIIPTALRRALVLRDEACAMPGCDRPSPWCDGHHITHWADGGPTALTNLVLLCGAHHHAVHHDGWTPTIDHDGLPTFHPPPWADPTGRPRRHPRYTLRQLDFNLAGGDPTDGVAGTNPGRSGPQLGSS